jgi:predicted dehydrogenase
MGAVTRRDFIKSTLAVGTVTMLPSSRILGANDMIRVGLIGCGGRGTGAHLPGFAALAGVTMVAVCDPDQERMGAAAKTAESKYGTKVDRYVDMRKLLDRKDIDVIANATQNYWHGLSTIWACQAGKHIYVEKPLSHYIWEGRQMVNAARKYRRIVQCGTQHRSEARFIQGIRWLREGHLGPIQYVVAFDNKPRSSCGKRDTLLPIPETIDYELWCGPAQKLPIYRDRLQYDCSFDWNTGDGESCNQGVHEVDVARWCLGEEGLPRRVISLGGRFVFNDACDVPNSQITYYDFATAPVLYEVHNLTKATGSKEMPNYRGEGVGIEVGHVSTAVCHTGNVSYRVGEKASRQEMRTRLAEAPLFMPVFERFMEHLTANGVDVDAGTVTLGPWLTVNTERERFRGDRAANQLGRGTYRAPYTVPEVTV